MKKNKDLYYKYKQPKARFKPSFCRKLCYLFRKDAKLTLKQMLSNKNTINPDTLSVYHCSKCGYWHLGHKHE